MTRKIFVLVLGLMVGITVNAQNVDRGDSFRADGNLIATQHETQSGTYRFVLNAGLMEASNEEKIFGSSVAIASTKASTALWNDARRAHVTQQILVLLAALPEVQGNNPDQEARDVLNGLSSSAGAAQQISDFLNAYKADYWLTSIKGAALHNGLSRVLRSVSRRMPDGSRELHSVNLRALGDALMAVQATAEISDLALGVALRGAVNADLALDRLDVLEKSVGASSDPAIARALKDARRELTNGSSTWGALIEELNSKKSHYSSMAIDMAVGSAMHAVGASGGFAVVLTLKLIESEWEQHDKAQVSVMAATVEEFLRNSASHEVDAVNRCELEKMAAVARSMYFDQMVEVTRVWLGRFFDALSHGQPYADARQYFVEQARVYEEAAGRARARLCLSGTVAPVLSCEAANLALLIDSSGSMKQSDPGDLRKAAASLLVDRVIAGSRLSVVDFDSSARILVEGTTDREEARRAAQSVDSNGGTNIKAALDTGHQILSRGRGKSAAILFTDGKSDQRGGIDPYLQDGIPVYVVGLGSGVDSRYLQNIAARTGGLYMQALRAGDLLEIFDRIVGEIGCEGTIFSTGGRISLGESQSFDFTVDPLLETLVVRLTWPGSRIDITLLDPSGQPAGRETASGSTYRIVEMDSPKAGKWTAKLTGVQIASGGENFSLRAGGTSRLRLGSSTPDPKDPTLFEISLDGYSSDLSVTKTWSRLRRPDGRSVDGPELNPIGGGRWNLVAPVDRTGVYTISFGMEGTDSAGLRWSRQMTRSLLIGSFSPPWRGRVTREQGAYLTINRGSKHGVRTGMRVTFQPGANPAGTGYVISVMGTSSTVEVEELYGSAIPRKGMVIELDRREWSGDWK